MAVISTQNISYRIVAGDLPGTQLDVFQDEDLKISNNVTGLFDISVLPSDFTRQITLPGTKINDAFFQHVYDISIDNPFLFATNIKVPCYIDFNGVYLINGYLQLTKVNVYQNKAIDSYEISIFGTLSSFGRNLNNTYLTDLTSLDQFNHTASYSNITASWSGQLFSGSIVYPLAEYGQRIKYNYGDGQYGIDDEYGALCVQDFKPAIRMIDVWDACFEEFGFTYTSSFLQQDWIKDIYVIANKGLKYPVMNGPSNVNGTSSINLDTYGLCKFAPISGANQTNVIMSRNLPIKLPWYNIESNPNSNLSPDLVYSLDFQTRLRGEINLNFQIEQTTAVTASSVPHFYLWVAAASNPSVPYSVTPLTNINNYMDSIRAYNGNETKTQKFELLDQFNTTAYSLYTGIPSGSIEFYLVYQTDSPSVPNIKVTLEPDSSCKSYFSITKVNQAGDGLIMNIADNMPYGTSGIKLVDFITSVQKKFNLVMYPDKTKLNQFIVETFNNWYKRGRVKSFDQFIDLNDKIEVIPANNLAVNKLTFGDKLDQDYVSQQFSKAANREFGKSYYIDTTNYFSQGEYNVETGVASSPLIYLQGTGVSGSVDGFNPGGTPCVNYTANANASSTGLWVYYTDCNIQNHQYYLEPGQEVTFCAAQGTVFTFAEVINNGLCY
jgi:hypothetical protein